ncbi:MAG: hypothetical protein LBE91_08810, partial [Tannerella sp.]|nr:hypothetical protein [Tannerella sp.]
QIQYKLNNRPRAKLNFYSPKEIFFLSLQNQKLHSVVESTNGIKTVFYFVFHSTCPIFAK